MSLTREEIERRKNRIYAMVDAGRSQEVIPAVEKLNEDAPGEGNKILAQAYYLGKKWGVSAPDYQKSLKYAMLYAKLHPEDKNIWMIAGNAAIPFGNMFFNFKKSNAVALRAKGTHSHFSRSFQDSSDTIAELGDILLRNQTKMITLKEFLEVLYYMSDERLIDWDPDIATMVFYCRDGVTEGDRLHFTVYNAKTRERQDYTSSSRLDSDHLYFYQLDESHLLALDRRDFHLYKWDITNDTTEFVTELPQSNHFGFEFLDDQSIVAAGTYGDTDDVWIYQESSGQLKSFPSDEKKQSQRMPLS